jgi:predicted DNA-binding ribbon-helix-helix protein
MKKRLTLTLPTETIKQMKEMAKRRNITVSQLVEDIILKFIAEDEAEEVRLKKLA